MTLQCEQCGKAFAAKRNDARFCSARCRVTANRVRDVSVTDNLPPLPDDPIIRANAEIGWSDVLAMPRDRIEEAYHVHTAVIGGLGSCVCDDVLLRLRRAAGYFRRVA